MEKWLIISIVSIVILAALVVIFFLVKPRTFSDSDILKDSTGAMAFCQESPGEKSNDCYFHVAEVLGTDNVEVSIQACSAISDDQFKKQCLEDLANKEQDQSKKLEICNKVEDIGFRQHCYGEIDVNSGNFSIDDQLAICDAISGSNKDNCYRSIADKLWEENPLKAVEVCQRILGSEKDNCLNNFMGSPELIKTNPTIAETICSTSSLSMKSRCYNDFARALSGVDPKQAAEVCQKLGDDVQISDCYNNVWFSFESIVIENYNFAIGLCNVLTLKKDDCLRRTAGAFMNYDRTKSVAICKLMSASASSGCLNDAQR